MVLNGCVLFSLSTDCSQRACLFSMSMDYSTSMYYLRTSCFLKKGKGCGFAVLDGELVVDGSRRPSFENYYIEGW